MARLLSRAANVRNRDYGFAALMLGVSLGADIGSDHKPAYIYGDGLGIATFTLGRLIFFPIPLCNASERFHLIMIAGVCCLVLACKQTEDVTNNEHVALDDSTTLSRTILCTWVNQHETTLYISLSLQCPPPDYLRLLHVLVPLPRHGGQNKRLIKPSLPARRAASLSHSNPKP